MNQMDHNTTNTPAAQPAPTFRKVIGKTIYEVMLHFNTNSTETMPDKIKRLIQNEIGSK